MTVILARAAALTGVVETKGAAVTEDVETKGAAFTVLTAPGAGAGGTVAHVSRHCE